MSVLDLGNDFVCGFGGLLLDLLNVDDGLLFGNGTDNREREELD